MPESIQPHHADRGEDFPGSVRHSLAIAAVWFGVALIVLLAVRSRTWTLSGHDAYYHLRFAVHVLENGIQSHGLPWLRMSVLTEQWGDKEFLFRLFLLPFVASNDLLAGGKTALCVLNALQAAVVAFVGVRWGGRAGALLPLLVLGGSMQVWYRFDLLRPHNLSLILLIAAVYLIGRRRDVMLGCLAAIYTLSYTACHTLWILCAGTFVLLWLDRRECAWRLLVYPALGIGVGLLLHPAFPHNILIWKLSNIDLFAQRDILALGHEINPSRSDSFLVQSAMGIFLVGVGLLTTRPWAGVSRPTRQEVVLGGFAFAFVVLNFMAYRFIEYAAAFTAMYLFVLYRRLSRNPSHPHPVRKARNRLMAVLVGYAVVFNVVFMRVVGFFPGENEAFFASPSEMNAFAEAIPDGARVASAWDSTSLYHFAAPHGRYLNQVDPVFLYALDAGLYPMAKHLHNGLCADPVAVAAGMLDSEYIALSIKKNARLYHQLLNDSRAEPVFDGERHAIFRLGDASEFVTDWQFAGASAPDGPPPEAAYFESDWPWNPYRAWVAPQPLSDRLGGVQPPGETRGWWARRTFSTDGVAPTWVRLAVRGRAEVRVDGNPIVSLRNIGYLDPDQVQFPLPLVPGKPHRIDVHITPGSVPGGFFWQPVPAPTE